MDVVVSILMSLGNRINIIRKIFIFFKNKAGGGVNDI